MIKLIHVSKTYDHGKSFVVQDVSFHVRPGELLVILGSSGSGKTTVLKMINRLIELSSGEIIVDGKNIRESPLISLRRSIGYVFQSVGLFPHMTLEENISISLRLQGATQTQCQKRAYELLETVNLDPNLFAKRLPDQLSGGQKQRVGVARSLACDPKLLLMDEPFGALDAINRDALQGEMLALKKRLNKTIIFVTHDILEALKLGDKIAIMNQGRLEQVDTPENIMHQPATEFVSSLFAKLHEQINHLKSFVKEPDLSS